MNLFLGLAIPFIGTALGSFMVFFMKNTVNKHIEKILLGFASGVMIAASVWSLLIPSINMATDQNKIAWIPAAIGFILGMFFLLGLDSIIPHLHLHDEKPEGINANLKKTTMLVLAVTLHNIPERNGCRSNICRCITWKCRNNDGRSFCFSNRNCNTKLSRRCNYINAT